MADRPIRSCDACGESDDHPRHVIALERIVKIRHLNCCAAAGCGVCTTTETVTDGARGPELTASIFAGALADVDTDGLGLPNG